MKIVDTFPYFNETELLELRIRLLYDYIDKFIICDGNRTHNGDIKEFTLKQTLIDLNLPLDKIKVIEVDLSIYDDNPDKWIRERAQRNAAVQEIEEDDICIVSDCDEIINPTFVKYCCTVASNHPNNIIRLPLTYLHGRADLQVISTLTELPYEWISAYICLPHHLLNYTLSTIRETGSIGNIIIYPNLFITENDKTTLVGWHFSWMGSSHRLIKKYKANVHFKDIIEYSLFPNSTEKTIDYISKYKPIAGRYDCFGRFNHVLEKYPLELLPSKLFELDRVKNFLLPIQNNNIDHIYTNSNFGENWFTFPNLLHARPG